MRPVSEFQNILIFNPAFLGDTILTTPLISAVRKLFPKAQITFMVRPEHVDLYTDLPMINTVIPYDKRGEYNGIKGILKFAKIIRAADYDLIINLHKSIRTGLLFLLARTRFIIGFKSAHLSYFFDKTVYRDYNCHEVHRNLNILSAICADYTLSDAITFAGPIVAYIDELQKNKIQYYQSRVSKRKKTVGLSIGSVWNTKRYPAISYAEVAHNLYINGYNIAIFGASSDKQALDEFLKYYNHPYFDYFEKLSLKELPTFISSVDLFITNDSGPLHIAVAVKTPTIAIFGPTVVAQGFSPYDDISIVLESATIECRPCSAHGTKKCPKTHFKCMKDIPPDFVFSTAIKYLGNIK